MLAPFGVRSFRFQWPADLMTSWAQEMENILLAWFILVETKSVVMLTLFGALTYLGTLMAPVLGVTGQRIGNKKTYCALRMGYTATALITMTPYYSHSNETASLWANLTWVLQPPSPSWG